jgi:hypothetical protein
VKDLLGDKYKMSANLRTRNKIKAQITKILGRIYFYLRKILPTFVEAYLLVKGSLKVDSKHGMSQDFSDSSLKGV